LELLHLADPPKPSSP